jgi:ABC-type antimicrobial peptide transport system permease subunit
MGLMIGLVVGYTICLQQALILGFTLYIVFPTTQFIVIVVLSFICAFSSTYGPTTHLLNK